MPATWAGHSTKVLGYVAPQTPVNEKYVATAVISEWLRKGMTERQIALVWNGGDGREKKGVNKYGVAYDTGAYANKVLSYLTGR